jgi:hypothetical protein
MSNLMTPQQEAENLERRFSELKRQGISQAAFARDYDVPGGSSLVNQHIKGHRPIGIDSALIYAKGMKCKLEEISPRLAAEFAKISVSQTVLFHPVELSAFARALGLLFDGLPEKPNLKADVFSSITQLISDARRDTLLPSIPAHQESQKHEKLHE